MAGSNMGCGLVLHSGDRSWLRNSMSSWQTYLQLNKSVYKKCKEMVKYSRNVRCIKCDDWLQVSAEPVTVSNGDTN